METINREGDCWGDVLVWVRGDGIWCLTGVPREEGGGCLDSSRVFILSNRRRAEDMGTDVNRWMGVMVEVCGCSLLIDFIFSAKREVRSSG